MMKRNPTKNRIQIPMSSFKVAVNVKHQRYLIMDENCTFHWTEKPNDGPLLRRQWSLDELESGWKRILDTTGTLDIELLEPPEEVQPEENIK